MKKMIKVSTSLIGCDAPQNFLMLDGWGKKIKSLQFLTYNSKKERNSIKTNGNI